MTTKIQHPPQSAATLVAAIGARGTDAALTVTSFESIKAQIGGTVRGYRLDQSTAIYYSTEKQTKTLLDPQSLAGTLALCGLDQKGNPASLTTLKQIKKHGKVFKATAENSDTEPGKEVKK